MNTLKDNITRDFELNKTCLKTLEDLLLENKQITFPDNYGIDYEIPIEILYDEELAKVGLIEACLPSHIHIEKYVNK